jgi:hypothetical protein
MDETRMISDVMALVNEMWIYIAAIWATTELVGSAIPQIPNKLFSVLVAIVYGVGAHLSGYMVGGWFLVVLVKTPIAAIAAGLIHDRIYNVFKKEGSEVVKNIVATVKKNGNGNNNTNNNINNNNNNKEGENLNV